MSTNKDSWTEYQRLVLSELERLDETIKETIKETNSKLDKLIILQETVGDLKKWKDEKADPEIQSLKEFKTQAKTYGTVGQVFIAAVISFIIEKLMGN